MAPLRVDVLVDQGDSGYYPANALPARRARWDAAQGWAEGS